MYNKSMSANAIPHFVRPFLWSFDIDRLDLSADKERIITNILNLGDDKAVNWLFSTYDKKTMATIIAKPRPGEWNKKSLNYWSLIFGVPFNYPVSRLV